MTSTTSSHVGWAARDWVNVSRAWRKCLSFRRFSLHRNARTYFQYQHSLHYHSHITCSHYRIIKPDDLLSRQPPSQPCSTLCPYSKRVGWSSWQSTSLTQTITVLKYESEKFWRQQIHIVIWIYSIQPGFGNMEKKRILRVGNASYTDYLHVSRIMKCSPGTETLPLSTSHIMVLTRWFRIDAVSVRCQWEELM